MFQDLDFNVWNSGFRVESIGFMVLGRRVWSLWFRVYGL